MKAIQTFYSFKETNYPIDDSAGFLNAHMNWMSTAISCLLLKDKFDSVSLYCNESVANLVADVFTIPYNHVIVTDNYMEKYDGCNLWAYPKINTYSQQSTPFVHVDTDFFMFTSPGAKILSSDLIGQNIEYDDQYSNRNTIERLLKAGVQFPDWAIEEYNQHPIIRVINAGVLGGNNIAFFQKYVEEIDTFISSNIDILRKQSDGYVNSIYEQFFFYILAKRFNQKVGYFTSGNNLSTTFDWLPIDWGYSPKCGYMHLLAGLKRRFKSYLFVNDYLKHLNPQLHKHIFKVCLEQNLELLVNDFDYDSIIRINSLKRRKLDDIDTFVTSNLDRSDNIEWNKYVSKRNEIQGILNTKYNDLFQTQKRNREWLWSTSCLTNSTQKLMLNPDIALLNISKSFYKLISSIPKQFSDVVLSYDSIVLGLIPDPKLFQLYEITLNPLAQEIVSIVRQNELISAKSLVSGISDVKTVEKIDNALRNLMKVGIIVKAS